MRMPQTLHERVNASLMVATAALLLIGLVVLWRAASFQGYIAGLLVMAIGLVAFVGARELTAKQGRPAKHPAPDAPAAPELLATHDKPLM